MNTEIYYNLVQKDEIRKLMEKCKIDMQNNLSQAINEEIIKEAENFHVMTYINLTLLNSASNNAINEWNIENYFDNLKGTLEDMGYKTIDLYTLEVNKIEDDESDTKSWVEFRKTSEIIDGFLVFWDDGKHIEINEKINSIKNTIENHIGGDIENYPTTMEKIDFTTEEDCNDFIALVNKYNSYKEVRL